MIIPLNEIMTADINELDDMDMQLAYEIECIERQLQHPDKDAKTWREKAMKARPYEAHSRTGQDSP